MSTFLLALLCLDFLCIGILLPLAVRHGRAHVRTTKSDSEALSAAASLTLPPEEKARLAQEAQARFQTVLSHASDQLQHDLLGAGGELTKLVQQLGAEIVSSELERYRVELAELRKQAEVAMSDIHDELAKHQDALQAQLAKELAEEKQRLVAQINTKLADAVTAFLLEALQHEVDLGAQTTYLMAMLEDHKAELNQELSDES